MYQNLPAEMQALRQWVVWSWQQNEDGKWVKIPYQVGGHRASVMTPAHWSSFAEVLAVVEQYSGIGFVLSGNDPYSIIDLDDKPSNPATDADKAGFRAILQACPSYTETSPSGSGLHIVVKGTIPEGMRYGHVEIYSSGRYMACTGNVLPGYPTDIRDAQAFLTRAYTARLEQAALSYSDGEEVLTDAEVCEKASDASDGEKYILLCGPDWEQLGYPSGSEAEFSLLSILCFWTKNNAQVMRLFRMTTLGKRQQSYDGRVKKAIARIRARQEPTIDFSAFNANLETNLANIKVKTREEIVEIADRRVEQGSGSGMGGDGGAVGGGAVGGETPWQPGKTERVKMIGRRGTEFAFPAGLVGDIAQYVLDTSVRPIPEVALTAALAFMAGICGRSYNYSRAGLNLYTIMVGGTGVGKEGASEGIGRLFGAIRQRIPSIEDFRGPSRFASGPGLARALEKSPCFVSVLGEFGQTLQALTSRDRNSADAMLHQALLDVYNKSGYGQVLAGSSYSQIEKNCPPINSPALSFIGECTPSSFYDGMTEDMISTGLLPRMLVIDYAGNRPRINDMSHGADPSPELTQRLCDLAMSALTVQQNNSVINVRCEQDAMLLDVAFGEEADDRINGAGKNEVVKQLWNRAHFNSRKLAAILAVGTNMHAPAISKEQMAWAIALARNSCDHMVSKFDTGEIGVGDSAQVKKMEKCLRDYLKKDPMSLVKRHKAMPQMHAASVVPYSYLQSMLTNVVPFSKAKYGAAKAVHETIDVLVKAGHLEKVTLKGIGFSGDAYRISLS